MMLHSSIAAAHVFADVMDRLPDHILAQRKRLLPSKGADLRCKVEAHAKVKDLINGAILTADCAPCLKHN
eukprot:14393175-Alexandrium_andersonii.AAC.1